MSNSRTSFVVVGDWQLHQIFEFPDCFIVEVVLLIDEFSKGSKAYKAESIPSQSAIQRCGSRPKKDGFTPVARSISAMGTAGHGVKILSQKNNNPTLSLPWGACHTHDIGDLSGRCARFNSYE